MNPLPLPRYVTIKPAAAFGGVRFIERPTRAIPAFLLIFALAGVGFFLEVRRQELGEDLTFGVILFVVLPAAYALLRLGWRWHLDVTPAGVARRGRLFGLTLTRRAVPRTGPVVAKAALHDGRARVQPPPEKSDWRVEVRVGDSPALPFAGDLSEREARHLCDAIEAAAAGALAGDLDVADDEPDGVGAAEPFVGWNAICAGVILIGLAAGWNAVWVAIAAKRTAEGAGVGLWLFCLPFALIGLVLGLLAVGGLFCIRGGIRDVLRGDGTAR